MTKALHSPAPWDMVGPDDNIHIVQAGEPGMRICFMTSDGPCVANAHLIAASPLMAEALEEALVALEWGGAKSRLRPRRQGLHGPHENL